MDELLVVNTSTETPTVSARQLHETLEIKERFSMWFSRFSDMFTESIDFTGVGKPTVVNNGAELILEDYNITSEMAKHICMMCKTDKGRQCRQYFIELEHAWNTPEQVMSRALRLADKTINGLTATIAYMKPKADFFDAVADSKTAIPMDQVAKVLDCGLGRNKIFELLRNNSILQYNNIPYQKYVDLGYFRVVEQSFSKPNGEKCVSTKTLVFQRGLDFIRKQIKKGE